MDSKKINRTRNNKITVYLSDAELERLNSKVDRTLLNREQFIRNMIPCLYRHLWKGDNRAL